MHLGRKVELLRELKGMKQETLALKLGVSQQTVSRLEQSEMIEEEKLKLIASALEIPLDTIMAFNEESPINNINNFHDNSTVTTLINAQFNSTEKIVELYERLLKEKEETIALLKTRIEKE